MRVVHPYSCIVVIALTRLRLAREQVSVGRKVLLPGRSLWGAAPDGTGRADCVGPELRAEIRGGALWTLLPLRV